MPKGLQGQKRPADAIGCVVMDANIATSKMFEELKEPSGKTRSGKAGAKARADALSKEERSAIAKQATACRWG